jgi:uncharacterized protein with HEPN domain
MQPEDQVRVRHLVDAATTARSLVEGHERADLDTEEMLRLALTKLVELIGEAATQVTADGRPEMPEEPDPPAPGRVTG